MSVRLCNKARTVQKLFSRSSWKIVTIENVFIKLIKSNQLVFSTAHCSSARHSPFGNRKILNFILLISWKVNVKKSSSTRTEKKRRQKKWVIIKFQRQHQWNSRQNHHRAMDHRHPTITYLSPRPASASSRQVSLFAAISVLSPHISALHLSHFHTSPNSDPEANSHH